MAGGKNKAFMADPVAFMRKYSVAPADSVGTNIGDKAASFDGPAGNAVGRISYTFSQMQAGSNIAWLDFHKRPRGSGYDASFIPSAEGVVAVDGTFYNRPGKVKSYFLPWTAGGGIINLAIPPAGPGNPNSDVKYFFTATITGCSIFIKGTAQAPIIYHAGGQTNRADPIRAANYWRRKMIAHSGPGAIVAEVNKTDYVSQRGIGTVASPATANSDAFTAWIKNATQNTDLEIDWTFPWGCVMGIRAANGDWSFYLQQNATIFHYKFSKAHFYSKDKTVKSAMMAASRPLTFDQFFPGGLGHVAFNPAMPQKRL